MRRKVEQLFKKNEKGQVLVILALTIVGLVAIMGLAIDLGYMYVSYARLRRSVDSAALSATSQFKRGATPSVILNAAKQFLDLNNEPITTLSIENCYWSYDGTTETDYPPYVDPSNPGGSGDSTLCTNPPRKLVRVTASEDVPTFFLSVIGWKSLPITTNAVSEAASLEMVMVLDQSESMAWYQPSPNQTLQLPRNPDGSYPDARDPSYCNQYHDEHDACHPFYEVKQAAENFVSNYIYFPYDRVAIVTFAKHATVYDPATGLPIGNPSKAAFTATPALSNNVPNLVSTIEGLQVTEGVHACHHDLTHNTDYGGGDFPNGFDTWNEGNFFVLNPDGITHTYNWTMGDDDEVPCRLYNVLTPDWSSTTGDLWPGSTPAEQSTEPGTKEFMYFTCPTGIAFGDYSKCWTSNIGEGLLYATAVYGDTPDLRQQALWVTLLLTDGNANSAYYADGSGNLTLPYCPNGERDGHPIGSKSSPYCRDTNTLVRHCLPAATNYECITQNYGVPGDGGTAKFYWPTSWYTTYSATNTPHANAVDINLYDADDYARDQADALADGAHVSIFAIGLGAGVASDQNLYVDPGTPPAGQALLQYIAQKGGTDSFYQASNTELPAVFLAIANKIATRLTH